jgi:hypothetical protein
MARRDEITDDDYDNDVTSAAKSGGIGAVYVLRCPEVG